MKMRRSRVAMANANHAGSGAFRHAPMAAATLAINADNPAAGGMPGLTPEIAYSTAFAAMIPDIRTTAKATSAHIALIR